MSKKILLVDDEPDLLAVLAHRFKTSGYQVEMAGNGQEALERAREGKPDLIIMDVIMPDMNGAEVAALLAEDLSMKGVPIIFLTALQTKQDEDRQGFDIGGHTVFAKPFEFAELLEKTKQLIDKEP